MVYYDERCAGRFRHNHILKKIQWFKTVYFYICDVTWILFFSSSQTDKMQYITIFVESNTEKLKNLRTIDVHVYACIQFFFLFKEIRRTNCIHSTYIKQKDLPKCKKDANENISICLSNTYTDLNVYQA